ncbi:Hypothetical Protein FCC1311_094892 [Hondaea fermentalgiana]|uniref:Uncharacterized protein n=1 Tax=Hondaea fermentalgiana TaxID=2315210 RepID=A0A2R5GRN7_9STRA|nr:Hypothetical Protein FCC1311_094892 [Hondaea fermentalgiana]|eukprot:GBG33265.1 Hypothetical Protein FCC1311_094892 [Hondaea fermentalgiana]
MQTDVAYASPTSIGGDLERGTSHEDLDLSHKPEDDTRAQDMHDHEGENPDQAPESPGIPQDEDEEVHDNVQHEEEELTSHQMHADHDEAHARASKSKVKRKTTIITTTITACMINTNTSTSTSSTLTTLMIMIMIMIIFTRRIQNLSILTNIAG